MPQWHGKSKGTPLGYRIFVATIRWAGLRSAYGLLRLVAFYYFLFSHKTSHWILDYYRRLGYRGARARRMLFSNYRMLGQTLVDRVVLMGGFPHRFQFEFEGEAQLRKMVSEGTGGLLISAHIGNWEAAGFLLQRLGVPVHIVMFDGEQASIKKIWKQVGGEPRARIIAIRDDLSHIFAISEALKNNELVCIHGDRFLEGNKTLTASLLGSPAHFPAGPFLLATAFRVPVSFVFAVKESNLQYHLFASEWHFAEGPDRSSAAEDLLGGFVGALEKMMRQYPEQWYNYYDFWKQP